MYHVLGFRVGTWTNDKGQTFPMVRLYCGQEFQQKQGERSYGVRTYEFKVAGEDVLSGIAVGDKVNLYFDQYQRVNLIQLVD